ncbi:LAFE_0C02058g1_1 [Lachancea fermentati]|uniref:LAFE_0C02058g1_1 n=1 Tax=Lachancea fermentati TaxID=4955 RepID=A0A1G4M933_LACFM|nr:LAFE_0C02058g1_1 [Lachancea fermentati]
MNIWIAASDGKVDVVEKFLANGFRADSKDPNGYTPLHAAAAYGHEDLLRKLCAEPYNGDINVRDNDGDTPLHHCEEVGIARIIIEELGGDYTLQNNEDKTAYQVFEEDECLIDLTKYMRQVCGITEPSLADVNEEQFAQFKENIRYTLENDPSTDDPESIQRRQRIQEILSGDNPDEELENYVREMVRSQLLNQSDDGSSAKRQK